MPDIVDELPRNDKQWVKLVVAIEGIGVGEWSSRPTLRTPGGDPRGRSFGAEPEVHGLRTLGGKQG